MENTSFTASNDWFTRNNIEPDKDYIKQASLYISRTNNIPLEEAIKWVTSHVEKDVQPATMTFYHRDVNTEDKEEKNTTIQKYLKYVGKNNLRLSPSFTAYYPPSVKKSPLADIVSTNMKLRSKYKKEMHIKKNENDTEGYLFNNNMQINTKTESNSISGIFGTRGSVIYNPSAHASLTSTARTVTATANQTIERLLMANRQYNTAETVISDILSIITEFNSKDTSEYERVIDKYKIHMPTSEECAEVINRSTRKYWINIVYSKKILDLLNTLSPIERTYYLYAGDLHSLRCYNPEFFRTMLDTFFIKNNTFTVGSEAKSYMSGVPEDVLNVIHHMHRNDLKGLGTNYDSMDDDLVIQLANTTSQVVDTLRQYNDIYRSILTTTNLPPNVAYFKEMIRSAVVASDTDSALFSTQDMVQWYRGDLDLVSDISMGCCGIFSLFVVQSIEHNLKQLSKNMGIDEENLSAINMKSEYTFEVFSVMSSAKHYFAEIAIIERNVLSKPELEIKGVNLKNSNTPSEVRDLSEKMMISIMDSVKNNEKISIFEHLKTVYEVEQQIIDSISRSEPDYLRFIMVKDGKAYKEEDITRSRTQWGTFWNTTYGKILESPVDLPFRSAKIPITLNNTNKLKRWVNSISNEELRDTIQEWVVSHRKKNLNTMYIPSEYLTNKGIPEDIKRIINTHKVVLDIVNMMYLVLESISYYRNEHNMVMDDYDHQTIQKKIEKYKKE